MAVLDPLPDDPLDYLQIVVTQRDSAVTIAVAGEWDIAGSAATESAIREALAACPDLVILDLSQLGFVDSTGLHAAVELQERALQQQVRLEIVPGSRAVQRPFEICRLTDVLPFRLIT